MTWPERQGAICPIMQTLSIELAVGDVCIAI